MPSEPPVLIAGGGPVGVVTALALARQGLEVRLFEAEARVDDSPRAATTHAATLEMLDSLGLVDEVTRRGLIEPKFRIWDRASREIIAEFDFGVLKDDTRYPYVVQCEQHKLAAMTIDALARPAERELEFSARRHRSRTVRRPRRGHGRDGDGTRRASPGSYLIGADGGRSTVRKALGIAFEGYTHPERFLVLTTPYPFRRAIRRMLAQLFLRPGRMVRAVQGRRRRRYAGYGAWCFRPARRDRGRGLRRGSRAGAAAEVLPKDRPLPRGPSQHLRRASAGRGVVPQGPRVPRRRLRRTSTIRSAGSGSTSASMTGWNSSALLGRVIRKDGAPEMLDLYDRLRRPLERRICPAADHRQQEAVGGEGSRKARREQRLPAYDRGRSRSRIVPTCSRASLLESVRSAGLEPA